MVKTELTCHFLAAPNLLIPGTKTTCTAEVLFASKRKFINSQETLQTEVAFPSCTPLLIDTKKELTLLNQSQLFIECSKLGSKKLHPLQPISCNVVSSTNLADEIKDALLFLDRCRCAVEHVEQVAKLIELCENSALLNAVRDTLGNPSRSETIVQSDAVYLFGLPPTTAAARIKAAKNSLTPVENTVVEPCAPPTTEEPSATSPVSVNHHQEAPSQTTPPDRASLPSSPLQKGTQSPESTSAQNLELVAVVQRVYSALQSAEHLDDEENRVLTLMHGVLADEDSLYKQAAEMVKFFERHESKIIKTSLVLTNG